MTRTHERLAAQTAETLTEIETLIEHARTITARARRQRDTRLMRRARRIGEQLHAQHGLLSTVYDRELLASARALTSVCQGHLDAISEQLAMSASYVGAISGPRVTAAAVIAQRRALETSTAL